VSQFFSLHPTHPQARLIRQAAEIVRGGGVIAYPTDSSYALGCRLGDLDAARRIRQIRGVDEHHHLTLVLRDLNELGHFARLDNWQFRIVRLGVPGPFTFVLPATREVPRRLQHPRRSTVGLRVPEHPVVLALLAELGEPILSSTLILPGDEHPLNDAIEIRARLEKRLDAILDAGACPAEPTTVVDLAVDPPAIARQGRGDPARLGLAGTADAPEVG
jgi:tRNA threonylcarbamoyl adenosine modification protein (Sua5/YciO/YrdC/YwlC family)